MCSFLTQTNYKAMHWKESFGVEEDTHDIEVSVYLSSKSSNCMH